MWIFTALTRPDLKKIADRLLSSKSKSKKKYPVPKKDRTVLSKRYDNDVGLIFQRQYNHGIFETNIVSIVSRVEAFIQECMIVAIRDQPKKLSIVGERSGIPLDLFMEHTDHDDILERYVNLRCQDLMFGKPADYLNKAAKILSIEIDDDIVSNYVEMKASRDVIVHNNGKINQIYIDKVGRKSRGKAGENLIVDEDYFEEIVMNSKILSGTIQRETEEKYK